MKRSTLDLYSRVLRKIDVSSILDLRDHDLVISKINSLSSDSYKIMAYRAIHNMIDDQIYESEYKKLVRLQNNNNTGVLPMTLPELLSIEVRCTNELQQLVESFTIWINTHRPLRLDYYNIRINPVEKENHINYMIYSERVLTFYLNDFKNVRSFGPQVITYSDPVIYSYIEALTLQFGHMPEYLLYRYDKPTSTLQPFSSRIMYGGYLQDLLKKHTGHPISINTIRKIHESDLIQSEAYRKMTNLDKKANHERLLHSLQTAHESYNIIDSTTPL